MAQAISTTSNDIKSRISIGFLAMVAARAGCQIHEPTVDRDSVDVTIKPIAGAKVRIDVQVKATTDLESSGSDFLYDLPIKNYNDLRSVEIDAPQLLVVLDLHGTEAEWLACSAEWSVLQRSAYWLNLYGAPSSSNTTTVRVHLPKANLVTPEAVRDLMDRRLVAVSAGKSGFGP